MILNDHSMLNHVGRKQYIVHTSLAFESALQPRCYPGKKRSGISSLYAEK